MIPNKRWIHSKEVIHFTNPATSLPHVLDSLGPNPRVLGLPNNDYNGLTSPEAVIGHGSS